VARLNVSLFRKEFKNLDEPFDDMDTVVLAIRVTIYATK